jgi:hypothetical protein
MLQLTWFKFANNIIVERKYILIFRNTKEKNSISMVTILPNVEILNIYRILN